MVLLVVTEYNFNFLINPNNNVVRLAMSESILRSMKAFGMTPGQIILAVACIGSWWATIQPLPGQIAKLTETVQQLSTRVEIHTVLLNEIAEVKKELKDLRTELVQLRFKTANVPSKTLEGKMPQTNELAPINN